MSSPTLDEFLVYLKAYSDADHDKALSYYDDTEFSISLPTGQVFHGKPAFLENLEIVHGAFNEILVPHTIYAGGNHSFVTMDCFFQAYGDVPEGVLAPRTFVKGEIARFVVWAFYNWEGGKIRKIECAGRGVEFYEAGRSLDELMSESRARADPGVGL